MTEFPLPDWWDSAQAKGRTSELDRNRFKIRLAAMYYTPKGDVMTLSCATGIPRTTLQLPCLIRPRSTISGTIWPDLAIQLEEAMNNPHFTRKFFRPDLF